jgi:hypothetical protein
MHLYNPGMHAVLMLSLAMTVQGSASATATAGPCHSASREGGQQPEPPPAQVRAEFRVFAGAEEITASTRLRVMPTSKREHATTIEEGKQLSVTLAAGIYDVQALRLRQDAIVAIRWAERLVMMYYPDEGGRHLEVINFQSGFGALQIRGAREPVWAYDVAVFGVGDRLTPAGVPIDGEDYRLFVLKAGRYDIRVRRAGSANDPQETHWYLDIEVPADRTRLKQIDIR